MARSRCVRVALFGAWLGAQLACTRGERREAPPERERARATPAPVAQPVDARPIIEPSPSEVAGLDDTLLEASYETDMLANLLAALPRPTPTESSLVAFVGGVLDAIIDEPSERLAAIGVRPGARVYVSARALDDRSAALRKRVGEEFGEGSRPDSAPGVWREMSADARTLGVHVRASLPTLEGDRLLRTLEQISATPRASGPADADQWAEICATLDADLCAGWPQLLVWAQTVSPETLRVDAVYLFYPTPSEAEDGSRVDAIRRADSWPAPLPERLARYRPPLGQRPMELRLYSYELLALLEAEALADVVVDLAEGPAETRWIRYLDSERALREILAKGGLFDGLRLDMNYAAVADTLTLELSWLPIIGRGEALARMFAPVEAELGLPSVSDCGGALACGRIGGLTSVARFTELARGPYADLANVSRIMRQAGDRGSILLLASAWPRLLGTAGVMATSGRGLVGAAQSELANHSAGLGFVLETLDEDARRGQGLAYLRVDPAVLDALGPAALVAGLRLETISLAGADWAERGRFEDFAVYFVDAAAPDAGAWIVVADDCGGRCTSAADARVRDLLASEREAPGTLDPLAEFQVGALGDVAGHEALAYGDDPPVRAWLDRHGLQFSLRFTPMGPAITLTLEPSAGSREGEFSPSP